MPRKVFTAGEVLAAADVNNFLMDQTVMTFAGTAARGSAIGTATEGMVTWLNDQNALQVYDGTAWNGLAASGGNAIINGAFEINQRNFTSSTATGVFTFDRWNTRADTGTSTFTAQTFTLGSEPDSSNKTNRYLNISSTGQSLSSARTAILQPIESVKTFANETVTVSFYARSGSGTPFISANFTQNFGTGGSPSSGVIVNGKKTQINTTWTRYSLSFNIPSLSGKTLGTNGNDNLALFIYTSAGSDFNSSTDSLGIQTTSIDIWGVQVEAGPTANVFRRNANSIEGELAACQRYYYRQGGDDVFQFLGIAQSTSATASLAQIVLPVTMRVPPTSIEFSTLQVGDTVGSLFPVVAVTGAALTRPSKNVAPVSLTTTGTMTFQRSYVFGINNSLSGFLAFSSEL
jgi:hypothetical protein